VDGTSGVNTLFTYGTLRDAEYRLALFSRAIAVQPAMLADWAVVIAENGYFTLVHAPGESVAGDLLALDDAALALADAWEETAYERLRVEARDDAGALVPAVVYVRPTASRERAPAGTFARHDRAHVLAQIARCRSDYARRSSESA
jgi:gamma-glutamylcyclotransferase (GGCT)/AIG2-like uncharacterized protein YtfP